MMKIKNIRKTVIMGLALILMVAAWVPVVAQQNKTVLFPSQDVTIGEAFSTIEKQTPYLISVNHTGFDTSHIVRLTSTQLTAGDALGQILAGTGRTWVMHGSHILIIPGAETAPEQEPVKEIPVSEQTAPVVIAEPRPEKKPEPVQVKMIQPDPVVVELETITPTDPERFSLLRRETANEALQYVSPKPMRFALKTNLLYAGAALTPNLAFEFGVGRQSTIDIAGAYRWWNMEGSEAKNRKLGHWIVQPEYRWWLCERFNGHYFGAHVFGGMYNISEYNLPLMFGKGSKDYRYDGWMVGAGISYGYQLMLGRSWNLEFNVGVGYARMFYDRYEHRYCGELLQKGAQRNYFGPTKLGITLSWLIK